MLACVLDGTGLEARRLPSGTVALYRAQAPRPAPSARPVRRQSSADGPAAGPTRHAERVRPDAATGEALIGAAVYAPALGRGATTNAYGFFSLALPPGDVRFAVSYVGYQTRPRRSRWAPDVRLDLALAPDRPGGEVVVEAEEALGRPGSRRSVALTGEDVQALPALLGEADLLKALQLQPGVGGGAEGTAGLHVRGGTPDQTLLLLDGIAGLQRGHLFGFLSMFNADAVKRVELFKGGIPGALRRAARRRSWTSACARATRQSGA